MNYEQTHPLYDVISPVYRRNAALYDGGQSVEGLTEARTFLTQHPFERKEQYAIRLKRAAYRNYAAPTVDLFSSSVMKNAVREGIDDNAVLTPLMSDCDRQGNTPDQFFKAVNTRAAGIGAEFVLVDLPRAEQEARTMDKAAGLGLRPYFVRVPATDVIAWDMDDDGSLAWAVIRQEEQKSDGPLTPYVEVKTVTVWQKNEWRRYIARGGENFTEADNGEYSLNMVPLVPFLYEVETPMTGRAVIDDVASLIIRVFNQDSELDKMLFDAALPLLAAFGLSEDEAEKLVKATSALWRFGSADTRLEYVEPSGAAFASKRQQILDDVEAIREISLRQTRPKGAQVESAEAKRLDSVQLSSQLADYARSSAASERRCWEIAARLAGQDESAVKKISVKYNETFDPDALREKLTEDYKELRRQGDISREVLLRHMGWTDEEIIKDGERLKAEQESSLPSLNNMWENE